MTFLLAAVVLTTTSVASAQNEPPPEAMEHFQAGRLAYQEGRYEEAAVSLEQALALDPGSPTLLYNLARVYELMGDLDKAVTFAEQYLALLPAEAGEERTRVEGTLSRLRGARDWLALRESAEQGTRVELREITEQTIIEERGVADGLFWGVLVTGAVALAAGGATGALALQRRSEANEFVIRDNDDREVWQGLRNDTENLGLTTDILLGVGGAALVSAGLLYLLRTERYTIEREVDGAEGEASEDADVALHVGPLGLSLEGRF